MKKTSVLISHHIKINSKLIKCLSITPKIIKLLKENKQRKNPCDSDRWNNVPQRLLHPNS